LDLEPNMKFRNEYLKYQILHWDTYTIAFKLIFVLFDCALVYLISCLILIWFKILILNFYLICLLKSFYFYQHCFPKFSFSNFYDLNYCWHLKF
jgi:hypothetical protein